MAKNYFGVVLTTKEHDKYRLVVYRYKDPDSSLVRPLLTGSSTSGTLMVM